MSTGTGPISYQKRCSRFGLTGASTLYEAEDHLLLVEGSIRQRCRRFYFDKIQAIVVRPTFRTGSELIFVSCPIVFLLGLALLLLQLGPADEVLGVLMVLALPFLVLFLFCLIRLVIRGASQDVFVTTAVQTARVSPLGFRRASRRHLQAIHQRIEKAQRDLPPPGTTPLAEEAPEPGSTPLAEGAPSPPTSPISPDPPPAS